MKKIPSLLLKSLVSLALLALLFYQAEWDELRRLVVTVDWRFLAGGLLCVAAGVAVSCYKWKVILRVDGMDCPLSTLVRYYLIGTFFNNFLPTSIGGDAVRAYYLSRSYGRTSVAVSSILAERLSGLVVLLLFPVLAFFPSSISAHGGISWFWGALPVFLIFAGCLFLVPATRNVWSSLLPPGLPNKMDGILESLGQYLSDARSLFAMIFCSAFFNLLVVLVSFFVAKSLGLDIRFIDLMVVVPLVVLLTLVPFSLNGLGIREGGFIYFLSNFGVSGTEALSFSLLSYLLVIVVSIIGGLMFISHFEGKFQIGSS